MFCSVPLQDITHFPTPKLLWRETMRWMGFSWVVMVAFVVLLEVHRIYAAPGPQPDDMLKTLLKLDRMYSAIARPR